MLGFSPLAAGPLASVPSAELIIGVGIGALLRPTVSGSLVVGSAGTGHATSPAPVMTGTVTVGLLASAAASTLPAAASVSAMVGLAATVLAEAPQPFARGLMLTLATEPMRVVYVRADERGVIVLADRRSVTVPDSDRIAHIKNGNGI